MAHIVYNGTTLAQLSSGICATATPAEAIIVQQRAAEPALCVPATVGYDLNASLLAFSTGEVVVFEIENHTLEDHEVIFGSELGLAGNYTRYDQDPSGVDFAGMMDQFGGNLQKVQGFNALVCNHSVIASMIVTDSNTEAQANQRLVRGSFDLDANFESKRGTIIHCSPCANDSSNLVREYGGPFPLTDRHFVKYNVLAGTGGGEEVIVPNEVVVEIHIGAKAAVESFVPVSTGSF